MSDSRAFDLLQIDETGILTTVFAAASRLEYSREYHWRVRASLGELTGPWSETRSFTVAVGTVSEAETDIPTEFALHQNYPNPFNPSTTIRYDLPEAATVRTTVFDALGRLVKALGTWHQAPGRYSVVWEADRSTSGAYFIRMEAGSFSQSRRMLLMK